ncbi:MAG: protein kinase [Myxococcota bacterium]
MEEAGLQDPRIGTTLGGVYRLERVIGVGGMGCVYEATHEHLEERYAVKVLSEGRASRPDAVERFLREAKAAGRIDNEHIVRVVNFHTQDDGSVFLVMELLEGENLAARIAKGPLPAANAIDLATQTGDALQAAHDAEIVHRDLKPENIFVTQRDGRDFVKVLDFGISKIKTPEHKDMKLTETDQILGTPLYISPELARGVSVADHRTDVYALGVITYEMLTGTPPFSGDNHFQLLFKHGNETPDPPSSRNPDAQIPAHVEAAVMRALEKDPAARFENMRAFCDALSGKAATSKKGGRRWAGLALGAATVALLLFGFWPRPDADPSSSPETSETTGTPAAATLPSATEPAPAVAPTRDAVPATSDTKPVVAAAPSGEQPPVAAPEEVTVRLNSTPPGASVTLNGQRQGLTPLSLALPRGTEAKLRFSLGGHRTRQIAFVAEDDRSVDVTLRKKVRRTTPPIKQDF